MNHSFLLAQIRLYNLAKNQNHQDVALSAIGIHAGLLDKGKVALKGLTNEQRKRVVSFARQFLNGNKNPAQVKDPLPTPAVKKTTA